MMNKSTALLTGTFSPFRFECECILIPAYLALRRELMRLRATLAEFEFQVEVVLKLRLERELDEYECRFSFTPRFHLPNIRR